MRANLILGVALACLALACRGEARRSGVSVALPLASEVPSTSASVKPLPFPLGERILAVDDEGPQQLVSDDGYLYFRTPQKIARVLKVGGPIEVLATTPYNYLPRTLAVDASGVYWANDDTDNATLPPPWKGSLWRVSKTGGDAKELASLTERPHRIALDATTVYFASGDFTYFGTRTLRGAGGIGAVDKITGKRRGLASDFCAESLALDETAVYWASCDPSEGMILSGGLYRVSKSGGPKTKVPLTIGGAVDFPIEISLHGGRVYFRHQGEMSANDSLCFAPKAGGVADCSLRKPGGRTEAFLFDGDDLWLGVVPDVQGIDAQWMRHANPSVQVSSLATANQVGRIAVQGVAGLAVDETYFYWSSGHEIHARAKSTLARERDPVE